MSRRCDYECELNMAQDNAFCRFRALIARAGDKPKKCAVAAAFSLIIELSNIPGKSPRLPVTGRQLPRRTVTERQHDSVFDNNTSWNEYVAVAKEDRIIKFNVSLLADNSNPTRAE